MGYWDYYRGLRDYHRDPFPHFPTKNQGVEGGSDHYEPKQLLRVLSSSGFGSGNNEPILSRRL